MKLIDKNIQKVAFVSPNYITKSITDKYTIPALGLESIAANILDLVEVKLIDGKVRNLTHEDIMKEIDDFKPDIVGISCCFTIGINFALKIAKESKKRGYSTVLGGWHPSFVHSEMLKNSFIDVVVRGEGEITFRELVNNNDLEEIKGISYKNNGTIIDNPDRPLIKDLNDLPLPARHLRNKKSYFQIFQMPIDAIETSRGCPYKCTFCNIHLFHRGTYRTKSIERVIQELQIVSNQKRRINVLIVDDNFTANIKRVENICDLIIERDIKLDFICQSRIDVIKKNPNVIKKMSKAGFWLFFLGIETFNQKSLDEIQKNVSYQDIVDAIKILHKNNIVIIGSLLIGSKLDEEEKDTEQLIENVKKLGIDIPVYNIMTPLPGTKFRETLIEKGYLISRNWNEYNFLTAVNRLNNLSKEQLEYLLSKAYYYGYFNRSWKATFIKIARRKGLQLFIRPGKSIKAIREFLSFFGTIRRLKHKIESPGNSSNVITFHD